MKASAANTASLAMSRGLLGVTALGVALCKISGDINDRPKTAQLREHLINEPSDLIRLPVIDN